MINRKPHFHVLPAPWEESSEAESERPNVTIYFERKKGITKRKLRKRSCHIWVFCLASRKDAIIRKNKELLPSFHTYGLLCMRISFNFSIWSNLNSILYMESKGNNRYKIYCSRADIGIFSHLQEIRIRITYYDTHDIALFSIFEVTLWCNLVRFFFPFWVSIFISLRL